MRKTSKYCEPCDTEYEHAILGLVPLQAIKDERSNLWANVRVCTNCGAFTIVDVDESDVRRADKKYVHTLIEEGVISKEKGHEILGIDSE